MLVHVLVYSLTVYYINILDIYSRRQGINNLQCDFYLSRYVSASASQPHKLTQRDLTLIILHGFLFYILSFHHSLISFYICFIEAIPSHLATAILCVYAFTIWSGKVLCLSFIFFCSILFCDISAN